MRCRRWHCRSALEAIHTRECPRVAAVLFALSHFVPQLAAGYSLQMAAAGFVHGRVDVRNTADVGGCLPVELGLVQ